MLTFISNLISVLWKVPSVIGIIKAILDVAGSDAVKQIIEAVRDVIAKIKQEQPEILQPATETGRRRLIDRIKERLAQRFLEIDDVQFATMKRIFTKGQDRV
jgi:hypothetical protein